ncbi:helix-turn-helix transcriptional regulator [Kitasatospora sp. NPDC005856]|uniref:helix-turn-helix domain-containing protein n=1 Tax=Kitasatospora sp. NPDC005856 TaxID=3154566 RepID=UPI0033E78CDE
MPDRGVTGPEAEGVAAGPSARVELARTLREWRARAGELPQKTVARRLNIAQTTVSRYESPDGRHPAPEAAVRALWSCYRLAQEDLDRALALRARVDEELRAGAASAEVAAPVPVPVAAVAVAAGEAVVEAVVVAGAGEPSAAPAAGRSRHWVAWAAGAAAALAGVVAGGLLVHHLLAPTATTGEADEARPLPPTAAPPSAYPTTDFDIIYGTTSTKGTLTWYNRSVGLSGQGKSEDSASCRGTTATSYSGSGSELGSMHTGVICGASKNYNVTVPADVVGGAFTVRICLDDGATPPAMLKCQDFRRP